MNLVGLIISIIVLTTGCFCKSHEGKIFNITTGSFGCVMSVFGIAIDPTLIFCVYIAIHLLFKKLVFP